MRSPRVSGTALLVAGLLTVVVLAVAVAPLASGSPDGLEKVAADQGFAQTERDHAFADWPIAGYVARGIDNEVIATGVAGLLGVAATFGAGSALFALARRLGRASASGGHQGQRAETRTGGAGDPVA